MNQPTHSGYFWIRVGAVPEVAYVVWSVFRQCRTIYRCGQQQPVDERLVDITWLGEVSIKTDRLLAFLSALAVLKEITWKAREQVVKMSVPNRWIINHEMGRLRRLADDTMRQLLLVRNP